MKKLLITLCLCLAPALSQLMAIEEMPAITSKHGGIVKKTKNAILELVQDNDRTSIYITGHDHKNITDKKLSLAAIAHVDGRQFPVKLSFENDHYSVSPANSYMKPEKNHVLMLTITISGTVDRASFDLKGKK